MKIGLITGNHPRHFAFCNEVSKYTKISGHIIMEREEFIPKPPENLDAHLKHLWKTHFTKRFVAEQCWFEGNTDLKFQSDTLRLPGGSLNSQESIDFVMKHRFDVVFIFGTDIIKDPLFGLLPQWKVNLHLGLIPYYKGSITMFWPFYNLEPNNAGCTYHVIAKKVDTGRIIHQVRPKLDYLNGIHDVACKGCLAAYEDIDKVLDSIENSLSFNLYPVPDPNLAARGKLYTKSDWKPDMLRLIYDTFSDKLVSYYLNNPHISKNLPIVQA